MNTKKSEDGNYREWKKIYLAQFVDEIKENRFENAIDKSFNELSVELNQKIENYIKYRNESDSNDFDYFLDTEYLDDKLLSIIEMRIIYTYKSFEKNLKRLLKLAFEKEFRDLYKWDDLKHFFKEREINFHNLKNYQQVNDLRKVNNSIKHSFSDEIENKIKHINEFKDLKYMRHYELEEFYERVKELPVLLLQELSDEIYSKLYE